MGFENKKDGPNKAYLLKFLKMVMENKILGQSQEIKPGFDPFIRTWA